MKRARAIVLLPVEVGIGLAAVVAAGPKRVALEAGVGVAVRTLEGWHIVLRVEVGGSALGVGEQHLAHFVDAVLACFSEGHTTEDGSYSALIQLINYFAPVYDRTNYRTAKEFIQHSHATASKGIKQFEPRDFFLAATQCGHDLVGPRDGWLLHRVVAARIRLIILALAAFVSQG